MCPVIKEVNSNSILQNPMHTEASTYILALQALKCCSMQTYRRLAPPEHTPLQAGYLPNKSHFNVRTQYGLLCVPQCI